MRTVSGRQDRETIYAKLFEIVKAATGIVNCSRRLRDRSQIGPAQMPMACVIQGKQSSQQVQLRGVPLRWLLHVDVYLFVSVGGDENAVPAIEANQYLDAIEDALEVSDGKQTLGGLVYDCRISGDVESDEGTFGSESVFIIPIEILA